MANFEEKNQHKFVYLMNKLQEYFVVYKIKFVAKKRYTYLDFGFKWDF